MKVFRPWLIVTDLDGTLLEHRNYSHDAVNDLLSELEKRGTPVIFNTSKTRAELLELRTELHNRHPFVVENGSAIFIPEGYFPRAVRGAVATNEYHCITLGRPAAEIRCWLEQFRQEPGFDFIGFAEMGADRIVRATGLSRHRAELAAQREYSEAIQWLGGEQQRRRFCRLAQEAGFRILRGGRFLHILGPCDKGQATRRLVREYDEQRAARHQIIAAGDGANDVAMLESADLAIAVRSPVHDFPPVSPKANVIRTRSEGPKGWAEVIRQLLGEEGTD